MKFMKLAVALVGALAFGSAYAFHDGGVAYCDGCHTMHNSSGNKAVAKKGASTQFQGQAFLLQGSDNSSTCLNCHASGTGGGYHIMTYPAPAVGTAPANFTPAGDFAWLTQTFTGKTSYGAPYTSKGERHGHNVVAADYGLVADTTLLTAPGGSYAAANLSCASCHDPHSRARIIDANGTIVNSAIGSAVLPIGSSGSYGNVADANEAVGVYRLLAPSNYSQMSYTNPLPFNANPPVAVAPSSYNASETVSQLRVAYGKGMSEWCANCHRSIHNDTTNAANTALIHPAGNGALLTAAANNLAGNATGTTIAAIYNAYKKSGDLTGTQATSYLSIVPFEEGTTAIATLAGHADSSGALTAQVGPSTGTENVMCLSCHRAHAGGFDSLTRWQNRGEFLVLGGQWPGSDSPVVEGQGAQYSNGMNQASYTAAMYGRTATQFAYAQRSLCNKCHAKD